MRALLNARVLVDGHFTEGLAVLVDGDRIAAVLPHADVPASAERVDLGGATLVPGFIDTQVNGGGDVLFNDAPTVDTIRRIGAAHARFGTTGFLPTLISDDLDVIRAGVAAVEDAIEQGVPGVLGIHIEGPFINVARKGIHSADKIRPLDEEGIAVLCSLRRGKTLVTLAPELVEAATIRRLAACGIIVAAGHTAGSFQAISGAIEAGVTGFTHLFNAMSQLGNREPGAVGAALHDEKVWCSLIVDGVHVSPITLKLALRCKPIDRFVLVSDAMPTTGGSADGFALDGRWIRAENGRLVDEGGTLAGADLSMLAAVRNAHQMLELPLAQAVAMASTHPAEFLSIGHQLGRIAPGHLASLLALDSDLKILRRWINGSEDEERSSD
jgi:N-acetylglucosamine-6-phosphate deacetylase